MYPRVDHPDNDTFAGVLVATVSVGLDTTDDEVKTTHDLARLLLMTADSPIMCEVQTWRQV